MKPNLIDVVSGALRVPTNTVTDATSMETCAEWDSLAHVELMVAIESAYGVTIDDQQIFDLTSVGAIRGFLENKQTAGDAGH